MSQLISTKTYNYSIGRKIKAGILIFFLLTAGFSIFANGGKKKSKGCSYDGDLVQVCNDLRKLYNDPANDWAFKKLVDDALKSAVPPPGGWAADPNDKKKLFIWPEKDFDDFLAFFEGWGTFVPNHENGMKYYELMYGLCYQNESALKFVENEPGLSWTRKFVQVRGKYMDSPASINKHLDAMDDWYNTLYNPKPELNQWDDFQPPHPPHVGYKGYKTFNEFFTRELKPGKRPIAFPGDDSILVSPADGLVNVVNSNLSTDSLIHTKYDEYLNVEQLLQGSKYSKYFIGGTAADSVLLPPDYHRYHSPASGKVVESREVDSCSGVYFGMDGGFYTFANNGNIGGYKSKYGIFGLYHRGYYIIETENFGYIAMVPIGLDDISSVNFVDKFRNVGSKKNPGPVDVKKGEEVGHFAYGGSTIILLFQPGVFFAVKTQQGRQIGVLNKAPGHYEIRKVARPKVGDYYHYKKKKK